MSEVRIPRNLVESAKASPHEGLREWVAKLPDTIAGLERRWSLTVGEPFEPGGSSAWTAPARDADGADLALKVCWRHPEAEREADGLRAWDGQGTVQLHAADRLDDTMALLLERCQPGTPLKERPPLEQDEVIASLLPRLWQEPAPGHPFESLQQMCDMWADLFEKKAATRPASTLDPALARDGVALFRTLPSSAERAVLLCTDLHAGNVLRSQREPWLVIDPKPYVGDPTYDALQHMLNCGDRLRAEPDAFVRRMAGLLTLDAERLRLWLFARCAMESLDWPGLDEVARLVTPR